MKRCLTLLEVLIAMVLLIALIVVVAPIALDRLDERAFESAADNTNEQLMMARAHAQATGEAVEVTYSPQTGQVQARTYAPWDVDALNGQGDEIEPGTSPLAIATGDASASVAPGGQAHGHTIAENWASRALGRGISIDTRDSEERSASSPDSDDDSALAAPGLLARSPDSDWEDDGESLEDLELGQEVRLAVFMPDGSALVGDEVLINDENGRRARISINPWSGLPMFERLADTADETSVNDEVEPTNQPDDDATDAGSSKTHRQRKRPARDSE